MRRHVRKFIAVGVGLAGFLMLMGGLLADVLLNNTRAALALGTVGVLIMLVCAVVNALTVRNRVTGSSDDDEEW